MIFNKYPLQFHPIFKERIWGGTKLKTLLNKPITSEITGESWELSTVEGDVSIIANGDFKGKSLLELIDVFPEEVLGTSVYQKFGKQFPLLFKYLDAKEDLSIQVHPNDALAQKRHNTLGKTEMWYIMQADVEARIIVGFQKQSNAAEYIQNLKEGNLVATLDEIKVKVGDVFFLETGTIHAIGAGIVLAEIQQTSDITYRVYDWDRVDAAGNSRELHLDLALDAMNYNTVESRKAYSKTINQSNEVLTCPYFTTHFLPLDGSIAMRKKGSTFTVYMCVEGAFNMEFNGIIYQYKKGDTVLIPANIKEYILNGKGSLLEIYIS